MNSFARRRNGGALLGLALLGACASDAGSAGGEGRGAERREGEESGPRKRGSGISQLGTVVPGGPAVPSALSSGVDEERLWSAHDDWEPAVAADRSSPFVYQMTNRYLSARGKVFFRASSDGGETWGADVRIATSREQYDPQLAVADDGTVFAMWLELPRWRTKLVRSTDHGRSWTAPVSVGDSLPWTDHGWLSISGDGRDVYVAINAGSSYVVASHDSGASFGPPVLTEGGAQDWLHAGAGVAPDGTAYFGATEYFDAYAGGTNVHVLRSVDGGLSWQTTLVDKSEAAPECRWAPGCYQGFLAPTTGLAVDAAGTVVLAYNAGRVPEEPQQIWVRTSSDGVAWSEALLLSHSVKDANNAFPTVVAGPGVGDFSVVWQGDRNGDTSAWNTWLRRTRDAGRTWDGIVRLSTREDGAPYKGQKGYRFPYGDYTNAASDADGRLHVIWGSGTSYNGPGGTWFTRAW